MVAYMVVYDCFNGTVKIIEDSGNVYLIEVVEVSVCYPCQVQPKKGEIMTIKADEIYELKLENGDYIINPPKTKIVNNSRLPW